MAILRPAAALTVTSESAPAVTSLCAIRLGRPEEGSPGLSLLTGRERRIVAMLAEGKSNREIGEGLELAPTTVRNILTRVRAKLGVTSRTRLVRFAYEHGLSGFTGDGPSPRED